jgi:hypothetical protein
MYGLTDLAIVVGKRSWRGISLWKTWHSKNSLNSVSTCLRVVDTRRYPMGADKVTNCNLIIQPAGGLTANYRRLNG